jgi:hypothetical protein
VALNFPGQWRFSPPADGEFINSSIPEGVRTEVLDLIRKISLQGSQRWDVLELFKSAFGAGGQSSNESWAEYDLGRAVDHAGENAPVFIEQFLNGLNLLRVWQPEWFVPDFAFLNELLHRHRIGYTIDPPILRFRDATATPVPIVVPEPSLHEKARLTIEKSLKRSEELLLQRQPREAVQECLWVLETVSTAFRGIDTESGKVEGKYFNHIVRDLRQKHPGSVLDQILNWIGTMHGFLSSPTGGGIRHGVDLNRGIEIDFNQARLFCNLIRSYVQFLLVEQEELSRRVGA